jgi:hypothetical protein
MVCSGSLDCSPRRSVRALVADVERGQYIGGAPTGQGRYSVARPSTWRLSVRLARSALSALVLPAIALTLSACADTPAPDAEAETVDADPQLLYWDALQSLCGQAFEGRVIESVPPDDSFEDQRLVMHVRSCDMAEIRIPFFVGEDRSRTWVITPTAAGLRLKHDHRHEDGTEDSVTQYGGDTEGRGTTATQDFHADAFTAELLSTAATNIWTIEVHPGEMFAYALRREGRRFRVEFDLTAPIDEPPAPWGS